jgi:hypothetical protein
LEEEAAEDIVIEIELLAVDAGGLDAVPTDMLEDKPEVLSVKQRNASVQTDTFLREKIDQILEGLPKNQIMSFMNVLEQFISKEKEEGGNYEECFRNLKQVVRLCFVIFIIHMIFSEFYSGQHGGMEISKV